MKDNAMTHPNILFIIADQHNAKVLGHAGHPQVRTPHLDRMAAEGVRFTNAISQNPICTPSRMCYLSGQYPHNHGDYACEHGIMEKAPGICADAITRIPHLWWAPGRFPAGHVPPEIVETVDLATTLCPLAGLEPLETGEGWDPDAVRRGIRDFLERTRGCVVEMILKDTHTCRHQPRRMWDWVRIATEEAEAFAF